MRLTLRLSTMLIGLAAAGCIVMTAAAQSPLSGTTQFTASLRSGPDRSDAMLFLLPAGTAVQVEARNAGADWLLVHTATSQRGWILAMQLTFPGSPNFGALPVSNEIIGGGNVQPPAANPPANPTTVPAVAPLNAPSNLDAFLTDPSSYAARITPQIRVSIQAIYAKGLALGNSPRVFTKVGDCWIAEYWALGQFGDGGPYDLGAFHDLKAVIDNYSIPPRAGVANSWVNHSQVGQDGMNANGMFDPVWADPRLCKGGESPLDCELRVNHPSVMLIILGMSDVASLKVAYFNYYEQQLVATAIQHGVVPILTTVPNPPGSFFYDRRVTFNNATRDIAAANNLPLIDLVGAADNLPDRGVDPDGVHPSPNRHFTRVAFVPNRLKEGADLWDFLALQSLYNVWNALAN